MHIILFCMASFLAFKLCRCLSDFCAPEEIRTPAPKIAAIRQLPLMIAANAAKMGHNPMILLSGAPEEIRTPDPQIRSPIRPKSATG
jgi:hypothetical protein